MVPYSNGIEYWTEIEQILGPIFEWFQAWDRSEHSDINHDTTRAK